MTRSARSACSSFALAALTVGSLIAALAPTIGILIFARVVQGIGGGVLPLTFGIIRDEFPRDKVAGAVGTSAALLAVGGGVGLVIAGPVVSALGYHWLFWVPMIDDPPGSHRGRCLGARVA